MTKFLKRRAGTRTTPGSASEWSICWTLAEVPINATWCNRQKSREKKKIKYLVRCELMTTNCLMTRCLFVERYVLNEIDIIRMSTNILNEQEITRNMLLIINLTLSESLSLSMKMLKIDVNTSEKKRGGDDSWFKRRYQNRRYIPGSRIIEHCP